MATTAVSAEQRRASAQVRGHLRTSSFAVDDDVLSRRGLLTARGPAQFQVSAE